MSENKKLGFVWVVLKSGARFVREEATLSYSSLLLSHRPLPVYVRPLIMYPSVDDNIKIK